MLFSLRVRKYLKTSHPLIFTLDSTLQGKGWNIFSCRFRLVHACLAAASSCHSVAHFKVCFRTPHSKSRASSKKTAASFKLPQGFLLLPPSTFPAFFFCRQRRTRRALMDLQTKAAAMCANPQRSLATLLVVCPRDHMRGNRSSAPPKLFHYQNIDHRREGWCQYSHN